MDFHAGVVRLEPGTTKNNERREFPCSVLPELHEPLVAQRKRTAKVELKKAMVVQYVFHRDGKPVRNYRNGWKKALSDATLPGFLVHDLPRSVVRNLVRAGVPEQVAMMLSGHKTRSIFDRYAIV